MNFRGIPLQDNSTADYNTAVGYEALQNNTTGANNTATGTSALSANTTGGDNTADGWEALQSNTSGQENVATGVGALSTNSTGGSNEAFGVDALASNSSGSYNTAVGLNTLESNTTAGYNTAVGDSVLLYNTTGADNTAVGVNALLNNTTGGSNLALGENAGGNLVSGSGNIYLSNSGASSTESDTIRIGTGGTQTAAYIAGITGVTVTGVPVLVSSSGQLGVQTSSARYKQDIQPMAGQSDKLMELKPITFHYKQDPAGPLEYGLVAEQVAEVYPDLTVKDSAGQVQAIRYQELTPMLLNEVQKQSQALRDKDTQIAAEQRQIEAQRQQVSELVAARLGALEQRVADSGSLKVALAGR